MGSWILYCLAAARPLIQYHSANLWHVCNDRDKGVSMCLYWYIGGGVGRARLVFAAKCSACGQTNQAPV